MNSYETGIFAEFIAKTYLRLHGYRIVDARYTTGRHTGRAEIDIIAKRKNCIVFCEVKRRPDLITGLDAITYAQQARLRRAAETYLIRKQSLCDARFDVIVFTGRRIHWIKNAF